ncbi:DUF1295-domain-containing protein [Auricularia subglabra TFB-10046 SS5]|nr:DUF1295-domain-containing protein [Auricularia subglabra TFB-10046 SS5]
MDAVPPTLRQPVYFLLFNCAWTYVVSELTDNVSQVDRVWTFLPTLYTAYYAFGPALSWAPPEVQQIRGGLSDRALLMFTLQFIWMCRLSYNTYRRGLFSLKDEDYRWVPLRKAMPGILFKLFNFGFIAITQNILLFMFGLPAHDALTQRPRIPLGTTDYALTAVALTLLVIEFTADNQQYAFQTWKHSGAPAGVPDASYAWPGARIRFTEADRKRGFMARGLWGWSRHPNFACEQAFWVVQTLFPILAAPKMRAHPIENASLDLLRPLAPAIGVLVLFFSSTLFTEKLSSSKYPAYKAYKKRVGMFLPQETVLRGLFLQLFGNKEQIDEQVWGNELAEKKSL